jgi:predicted  nucleic acid-binding Zn-ribbon protein
MNKLKGLQNIPSAIKNVKSGLWAQGKDDECKIFNELAQLSRERMRLNKERENWQEKLDRIDARLEQIEEQEETLRQQIAMKISAHAKERKQSAANQASGSPRTLASEQRDALEGQEMVLKY